MMSSGEGTKTLIEQLRDPTQSHRAVLALAMKGPDAVPALAEFLRPSKPSSLSEPRLMAVECLSILKGPEALEALITVCKERLNEIADSIVRLAEEAVVSRAASALADYPGDCSARETLLELLKGRPVVRFPGWCPGWKTTSLPKPPGGQLWLVDPPPFRRCWIH